MALARSLGSIHFPTDRARFGERLNHIIEHAQLAKNNTSESFVAFVREQVRNTLTMDAKTKLLGQFRAAYNGNCQYECEITRANVPSTSLQLTGACWVVLLTGKCEFSDGEQRKEATAWLGYDFIGENCKFITATLCASGGSDAAVVIIKPVP